MVFYRKYRPQTIGELDSKKVKETLYAVLSSASIPHAFLFTGPKGLGKTSTARIIAKVVNCEHINKKDQNSIEPDGICEQCISITNGTNLDVIEIDGASNRGIDEIRDLRDKVKLAPSMAKKKVYIIDEVHMLTTEAFNALLKTIEEPPSHVMFLFCTTEPHKVPATILSRCFHIAFALATEDEIVDSLKRIVAGENIAIDDESLKIIASMSEGGFRDGTKILEEIVALAQGKKITKELVEKTYQITNMSYFVSHMLKFLIAKKTKEALGVINEMLEKGIDVKYFLIQLLETLHQCLLQTVGIVQENKTPKTTYTLRDIQTLVVLFSEAYQQTKFAVIPQLPLEMAVILFTQNNSSLKTQEEEIATQSTTARNDVSGKPTMSSLMKKQQVMKVNNILRPELSSAIAPKIKEIHGQQADIASASSDPKIQMMENLIYKIKPLNHSLAGVLRGCKVVEVTEESVLLEAAYRFHKERLEEKKSYEIIEKAIKELTGKSIKVVIELKK